MTDFGYDDLHGLDDYPSHSARAQKLVNLAGAMVSLALVGGMGVWGYKLMVRDVSGVPVIEAIEGAFRSQPDDPGGMTTPHQGLQVNEIAAVGAAAGPVEEVQLAPKNAPLADEDWPWGELMAAKDVEDAAPAGAADGQAAADAQTADAASARDATSAEDASAADDAPKVQDASIRIVDDALAGEALGTDLAVAEALAGTGIVPASDVVLQNAVLDDTGLRPEPRPVSLRRAAAKSTVPETGGRIGAGEVSVADLPRGTRLVQLGAYASPEIARSEWTTIGSRFTDFFAGKRLVVQEAVSGGKTFYRLRAEGFEDLADARRFCSALTAKQADCIPVEVR